MGNSTDKDKKPKSTHPPEQKLGDTPVPPWDMPTPEEKAQAEPVRRALKEAIARVDSPEKVDEVIDELEAATSEETGADVEQAQPPATMADTAVRQVEKAANTAPKSKKTERVLEATARTVASPDKRQREVVGEAVQEVLNPEQQGAPRRLRMNESVSTYARLFSRGSNRRTHWTPTCFSKSTICLVRGFSIPFSTGLP